MAKKSRKLQLAIALSSITQIGISVLVPIFVCIYGAGWLKEKLSLGNWVVVLGIVLGIGSGMLSMIRQLRAFLDKMD